MASWRWIGFIALRYISRGRRNRSSASSILAILGILIGVLTLTVILAVMNGFQLGFIESIVEISSYHLRFENFPADGSGKFLEEKVRSLPQVAAVVPFREIQAIVRGKREEQQAAVIRCLPRDALALDSGFAEKLVFEEGQGGFSLDNPNSVVPGAELARRLGARLGDTISLVSLSGDGLFKDAGEGEGAVNSLFTVTGIFRSGFYEYDLGWAFIGIDSGAALSGEQDRLSLGVKLKNRWQDGRVLEQILRLPEYAALSAAGAVEAPKPWRDYNRAFYGALRTEKLMMFILVGLIFIVVGLNIFQAQRRSVLERREEIGLLRAMGATDVAVRFIFVWDGFVIGFSGAAFGTGLGLFIASHIAVFFNVLEGLVNAVIDLVNLVLSLFGVSGAGGFAVFSPAIFYIKEIPSRVIPGEVALIFLFGFLSALLAAWFASGRVSRTRPAEVLRCE
ncbi:MAG: ABC transporter permease [Spirochaetaceae bacterium]|jgi:lipoprotein-releasing system permease protein|nr:ABC transporter permease [Spirochaetaceae bacterium]